MSGSRDSRHHSPDAYGDGRANGEGEHGGGRGGSEYSSTLPPAPRPLGQVVFWVVWWIILTGLWIPLAFDVMVPELVAGMVAAAAGATLATAVRAQRLISFRPRLRWALRLWRLPSQVVLDTGILIAVLWRRLVMRQPVSGSFRAIPFRAVAENPEADARRALAATIGSIAPNTYVVDIDEDSELILVHQLVSKPGDSKSIDPLELG
jgi:multisubunit Na+/H+ antiporter MnhE subunit